MIYFQSLTKQELADLLLPISQVDGRHLTPEEVATKSRKRALYRARQIFVWVYQRHVTDWAKMTDLSKDLRAWLAANIEVYRLTERLSRQALDGTHKFLWDLHDQKTIESVIIPAALQEKVVAFDEPGASEGTAAAGAAYGKSPAGLRAAQRLASKLESEERAAESAETAAMPRALPRASSALPHASSALPEGQKFAGAPVQVGVDSPQWARLTACISSQVGCAMACKFCLTGVQGLDRSLQTHEIVTQVFELRMRAPITNIVFMGMGEPLHNLDNVAKACQILLDSDGLAFSKRKVTVSTSGLVPALEELGRRVDVSIAISLNGTTDEQRSLIMPVNKKWNIEALLNACRNYPLGKHRRITFEYVMLAGINDTLEDAARLVKLTRGIPSKINLIPFNEHPASEFKRPTDEVVRAFQRYLVEREITATVRISRGRDILAACGQLRSIFGTARGTQKHRDWKELPVVTSPA